MYIHESVLNVNKKINKSRYNLRSQLFMKYDVKKLNQSQYDVVYLNLFSKYYRQRSNNWTNNKIGMLLTFEWKLM